MVNWVWIDIETTGLRPEKDKVLEIACAITTPELSLVGSKSWLVKVDLDEVSALCDEYVLNMHVENGLFEDLLEKETFTLEQIDDELVKFANKCEAVKVDTSTNKTIRSPLCGQSVHFDRSFLQLATPNFIRSCVTHRHIDVSTIHLLADNWYGDKAKPKADGVRHRALDDIMQSIAALRWYKNHIFSPYGKVAI